MDVVFDIRYKHEVLREALKEAIENGQFVPGDRLPSESEMCRMYGVSNNTVREAVASLVSEGLACRVHGKGTFVTQRTSPASQMTILVVLPEIYSEDALVYTRFSAHSGVLLDRIATAASVNNIDCVLNLSGNTIESERACLRKILDRRYDGLILFYNGGPRNADLLQQLQNQKIPFVLIDRYLPDLATNYVVSDNANGAYQATKALLEAGYKTVYGIFDVGQNTTIEDRIEGLSRALSEAGVSTKDRIRRQSKSGAEDGAKMAYELTSRIQLADPDRIGFFASNASMAEGIWQLIRHDPECQNRFALAAFDWIPEEAKRMIPTLVVRQPLKEIAETAIRILENQTAGDTTVRRISLPVTIESELHR